MTLSGDFAEVLTHRVRTRFIQPTIPGIMTCKPSVLPGFQPSLKRRSPGDAAARPGLAVLASTCRQPQLPPVRCSPALLFFRLSPARAEWPEVSGGTAVARIFDGPIAAAGAVADVRQGRQQCSGDQHDALHAKLLSTMIGLPTTHFGDRADDLGRDAWPPRGSNPVCRSAGEQFLSYHRRERDRRPSALSSAPPISCAREIGDELQPAEDQRGSFHSHRLGAAKPVF